MSTKGEDPRHGAPVAYSFPLVRILLSTPRFVAVDKPSGLSVHRGWDASRDTLMHRVRDAVGRWVYPVHRLDRATSGVVVLALDPEAAAALGGAFAAGTVEKEYVALVRGGLDAPGTIDHPIAAREGGERVAAITDYAPIAIARDRYTLVRAWPRTGRQHQIRRHMKHISRPLLGDTTYGDGRENRKLRQEVALHRLALHASRIAFPDPEEPEQRIEVRAAIPEDLRGPLEQLGFGREVLDGLA